MYVYTYGYVYVCMYVCVWPWSITQHKILAKPNSKSQKTIDHNKSDSCNKLKKEREKPYNGNFEALKKETKESWKKGNTMFVHGLKSLLLLKCLFLPSAAYKLNTILI